MLQGVGGQLPAEVPRPGAGGCRRLGVGHPGLRCAHALPKHSSVPCADWHRLPPWCCPQEYLAAIKGVGIYRANSGPHDEPRWEAYNATRK
jgi:hypothetical protein